MPCRYTLHPDIGILHCRFSGHLHLDDILGFVDRLLRDPGHRDGTNILADARALTRLDIDGPAQRRLSNRLAALERWRGMPRSCAIIAAGEPVWSLVGSIVATTSLESPVVFDRFRNPSGALAFVGLNPRLHSDRFGYLPVP